MGLVIRALLSKMGVIASFFVGFIGGNGVSGFARVAQWAVIGGFVWIAYQLLIKK